MARDRKEGYLWKHGSYAHVCRPHWCTFTWHIWVQHPVQFTISLPVPSVCACVRKGEEERELEKGPSQKSTIFLPTCPGVFITSNLFTSVKNPGNLCGTHFHSTSGKHSTRRMMSSFLYSYDFYSIFQTVKTQRDACKNEISDATASY